MIYQMVYLIWLIDDKEICLGKLNKYDTYLFLSKLKNFLPQIKEKIEEKMRFKRRRFSYIKKWIKFN